MGRSQSSGCSDGWLQVRASYILNIVEIQSNKLSASTDQATKFYRAKCQVIPVLEGMRRCSFWAGWGSDGQVSCVSAGTLSNLQPVPRKAAIPFARAASTAPHLLGQMHPRVGQCLCLQFPVSLSLNLPWPLSRERAFSRASNAVRWGRNYFLQDCGSTCTDSGWWGISAATLSCS